MVGEPPAKCVAQELAPLAKRDPDDIAQTPLVQLSRLRTRNHAYHGAVHTRRRVETFRRYRQHVFHFVAPLQHHAQAAVGGGCRTRHHAVDHFLLQHEMLVGNAGREARQVEQDRRGDVVRQIAHHAQFDCPMTCCVGGGGGGGLGCLGCGDGGGCLGSLGCGGSVGCLGCGGVRCLRDMREIHFQHVRLDHRQVRSPSQAARQIAVQFDHRQMAQTLHQGLSQRAKAGSDFHHPLSGARCDRLHDGVDDRRVGQEMLAESLARHMRTGLIAFSAQCRSPLARPWRLPPAQARGLAHQLGGWRIST